MKFELRTKGEIGEKAIDWVLENRGIENPKEYLNGSLEHIQDPFNLENMALAIDAFTWDKSTRILTVVDSDMDGYCSSAILKNYLEKVYSHLTVDYFIHEHKEHGLEDVVEKINLDDYSLVFVPDAGSNDGKYCKEYPNTTFIVLDHHDYNPENKISDNMIVVNPQLSPKYINKDLSGTGVTWQFLRALDKTLDFNLADHYYDMVAASIISDMMSLKTLENRAILKKGLVTPRNNMLMALADKSSFKLSGELTPMGVAFYIAPLVNAMCRVGTLDQKERMFQAFALEELVVLSQGRGAAKGQPIDVADESARECVNAKAKQTRLRTRAKDLSKMVIEESDLNEKPAIVVEMDERFEKIPKEMNGLSAQEISKAYNKPVFLGRVDSNGITSGSVRAPEQIPVESFKEFLAKSGLFEYVEGHAAAFGFSIQSSKWHKLWKYFQDNWIDDDSFEYVHKVDYIFPRADSALVDLCQTRYDNRYIWGRGVEEPVVGGTLNVTQADVTVMGSKGDTVKITKNGISFMFFKQTPEQVEDFISDMNFKISLVGRCDMNIFRGTAKPQIMVDDYKIEEGGSFLF